MTEIDNDNLQNSELECRVCRIGGDEERPLYTPCKCSGSIGLVHQDCLEAWLTHSKKDTCELCGAKYQFAPQYAENTPSIIPPFIFIRSFLKLTVFKALPFTLRLLLAIFIWLVLVPLGTTVAYCTCMRRNFNISWKMSTSTFASTVCYGIVIDAVMALSMLIIMSFADFLRFHWAPMNNNANLNNNIPRGAPVEPAGIPPERPEPEPVQQLPQLPMQNNINNDRVNMLRQRIRRPVGERVEPNNARTAERPNIPPETEFPQRIRPQHLPPQHPRFSQERVHDESTAFRIPHEISNRNEVMKSDSSDDLFPVSSLDETFRHHLARNSDGSSVPPSPQKKYILTDSDGMDEEEKEFHRIMSREFHDCVSHEEVEQVILKRSAEDVCDEESSGSAPSSSSSSSSSSSANTEDLLAELDRGNPRQNNNDFHGEEGFFLSDSDSSSSDDDEEDDEDFGVGGFDLRLEIGLEVDGGGNAAEPGLNNNNNNNLNNNNINLNNEDNPDVGIEIRIALFELLGLEGPFYIMFRNAAWLLAFSSVYITVLAFFPYMIGNIVMKLIKTKFLSVIVSSLHNKLPQLIEVVSPASQLFHPILELFYAVSKLSQEKNPPLQFMDLIYVATGYLTICLVVFVFDFVFSLLKRLQDNQNNSNQGILQTISVNISQLSLVIKVGSLLVVRIFLLPITLGSAILCILSHHILDYTKEEWIEFLTFNGVGAYALAWVAGITFMLSVTISVLQLREVLHPTIFGKIIKPQEAHSDLIISLIHENGIVHARRIFVSCCVYALLLGLLIFSPILLYEKMNHYLHRNVFQFHFWYFIPQIQIPIELLLGHILFLSIVDKNKDIIGHIQHYWLVFICNKLDLTRFVLPLPMIKKKKSGESGNKRSRRKSRGYSEGIEEPERNDGQKESDGSSSPSPPLPGIEGEDYETGKPLLRPPAGWDIRSSQNSTRWAWGNEIPSALEKNVAPRIAPRYYLLKTFFLLIISFILLHLITLFIFTVPLTMGRYLFRVLYFPPYLIHDPLCFIIGSYVMITMIVGVYKLIFQSNLISNHLLRFHPGLLCCKYLYYYGNVCSWSFLGALVQITLQRLANFMIVGMMVHILSKLWNVDLYYGFFTTLTSSFTSSDTALNIGRIAVTAPSAIGSNGVSGVAGIVYDFTIFQIPNYFSSQCKTSFWRDFIYLLLRAFSFLPTGFIILETFIYQILSPVGMRLARYLQLTSTLTWINQCQMQMNRLIILMKEALAHNHRRHNNAPQGDDIPQNEPSAQRPHAEPRQHEDRNEEDEAATIARTISDDRQHRSHLHIHKSHETKIIQQMYEVYLLVYYPFYRDLAVKGFFFFVLPTIILSNQPILRVLHLLPITDWLLSRAYSEESEFAADSSEPISSDEILFSFRIHWMIMRGLIACYLVLIFFPFLLQPLYQSFSSLYNKIRDENYLVGRRLLNIHQQASTTSQEQRK